MQNNGLVLWGHSLADYQEMFDLGQSDLNKSILNCGSGPSSFNAEMTKAGHQVVSSHELYSLTRDELEKQINQYFQDMLAKIQAEQDHFLWDHIGSLNELASARQESLQKFLKDYEAGKKEQRYQAIKFEKLPYKDLEFDLALSSHFLFFNQDESDAEFLKAVLLELCRVAHEVRIFPLVNHHGETSPLVAPLLLELQQKNLGVEIRQVPYKFQKNGNAMLRIWAQECKL